MTGQPEQLLASQQEAFRGERPVSLEVRIDRIDRCIALLVDHQDEICRALDGDFGGRSSRATKFSDLLTSLNTLKFVRKNLKKWMRPERRRTLFPMGLLGARAEIHYQPKGVVGIMSPWNVPINLIFGPLADVLGAGNRAMVKPSEFNPRTNELLQTLLPRYFDPAEVALVTGGAEVGAAFAALPFDHLLFTGAGPVGSLVMQAAAKNLTPVTLELGGKSPVIVSRSADFADAAGKIMSMKAVNAGQVCISPDYCFVPSESVESFVAECRKAIAEQFPTVAGNPDYVSMIDERHYDRVRASLAEALASGARMETLCADGENWGVNGDRRIPIHLVIDPGADLEVMREELFGPVMCIRPYERFGECIDEINRRPRPLALYYMGKDKVEQQRVIGQTASGGVCINDLGVHFACDDLPFGGIGASGMGHYHGQEGFRTFSHARSVLKQGPVNLSKLAGTLPPYGEKVDKLLAKLIRK